jgi:hypothetical protein
MRRYTDAGRGAIAAGNFYGALSIALVMPDICAQLETPKDKVGDRYRRWFRKWAEPRFTRSVGPDKKQTTFVSAQDCYLLRCSLLHAGSAELDASRTTLSRFVFFDSSTGSHMNMVEMNGRTFLQVRADKFAQDLFEAAEQWDASTAPDAQIQARKSTLLTLRKAGDIVEGMQFM